MQKISKTSEWPAIGIGLFFVLLLTFGLIDDYYESGSIKLPILLFVFIFFALTIWHLKLIYKVYVKEDSIVFVHFLSRKTVELHKGDDISVEADAYIEDHFSSVSTETIILKQGENKVSINSESCKNYDKVLDVIFEMFPQVRNEYSQQVRMKRVKERKWNKRYEIIFFAIALIISIIWYSASK